MPVDTRDKRASVIGLAQPFVRVGPTPDGDFSSQADRQHLAYMYRGILAAATAASVVDFVVAAESRSLAVVADDRTIAPAAETRTIVVPDK